MSGLLSAVEPFHVMTPLGPAIVTHCFADCEDPEWVTWIKATGECFWWTNRHIRRAPNVTNGLPGVSPFGPLNSVTHAHIQRYRAAGWLPLGFDPSDPSTWERDHGRPSR